MLVREQMKNFYTASEAQKRLGLNENNFYYLVRKGKIKKVTPPGKSQGLYPRREIDDLAAELKALIESHERETSIFRLATEDDLQEEYNIDMALFGSRGTTPLEARQERLALSPNEGNYVLVNTGKIVGHVSFYPLEHETLQLALSGDLKRVSADKLLSFEAGVPLEIFVFIMAVKAGFPDDLTKQYGQRLLAGTTKAIRKLGERGIEIAGIYATSRYRPGIRLCRKLGMIEKPIANETGRFSFSLDMKTSDSLLVEEYREGLAEFKQEQSE